MSSSLAKDGRGSKIAGFLLVMGTKLRAAAVAFSPRKAVVYLVVIALKAGIEFSVLSGKLGLSWEEWSANASSSFGYSHHRILSDEHGVYRLLGFAPSFAKHAGLLPRRQQDALVRTGHIECFGHVRH